MKKQTLTLLIITLAFVLAGCAGHAAEEDTLHPLDATAWPTPVPAQPTPQPTPFPKIDLDDVRVSYTQADDGDDAVSAAAVEAVAAEPAGATEAAVVAEAQPAADTPATAPVAASAPEPSALNRLQPITTGQVNISAVNVRQGPGPEAAKQAVLTSGQQVEVLGVNPSRDWALIQTPTLSGWVSLDYLDLAGALDNAPVITPETTTVRAAAPVTTTAATQAPAPASSSGRAGDAQPAAPDTPEQPVAHLGPVATAHIAVDKTEVRPGPGSQFAPIDELTDPMERLTIVGVDPTRQWALVEPEFDTSRLGWVALSDVAVSEGDLAAAPEVYTGWTNSNALALRTGPGIYTAEVGRLAINNLVRVVGLNDGRSWARVQPILGRGDGWTQIQYLTLSDKVANIPLAPIPPSAPEPEPIDPALADASAKAGKLALQLSSGGDIVSLNADGTGLTAVTQGIDPQLSPDGSQVAFTRWEGGEAGSGTLWVRDLSSGRETAVLGFIKQPKGPDWSPDGSHLVINYQNGGRLDEQQVDLNLTERHANVPWNAGNVRQGRKDGDTHLYYTLPPDPHWGLRVVDVADGSYEDMDGGTYAFRPAWDPSQPWRIVSDGGRGLLAGDVNRADYHQTLTEQVGDGSPVFSPDGQYLALSSGRGGDGYDIYRLNADGSGRVRLTETPLWVAVTPEGQGHQWSNVAPAWSPDGSQIAFLTNRTGRWEVWVMNADGSNPRPMFSDDVNDHLAITYHFVDERMISWR